MQATLPARLYGCPDAWARERSGVFGWPSYILPTAVFFLLTAGVWFAFMRKPATTD